MASHDKTLYEVLGVRRDASASEVRRAYERIRAELRKETVAPNPRLAAMAKVAYETLSDPGRRTEYDDSLGPVELLARTRGGRGIAVAGLGVLAAVALAAYYFFVMRPGDAPSARSGEDQSLGPQELLRAVAPHVGRLQGAMMSGEVQELGMAVAIAEDTMAATCRGITALSVLTVVVEGIVSKAPLASADGTHDVCLLQVKGASKGVAMRPGPPTAQEKLQAVLPGTGAALQLRQVHVTRSIPSPNGTVLEVKAAVPLPNGTPVFDQQARLVGIVVAPHAFGEGVIAALGAARIAQAQRPGAAMAAAPPAPAGAAAPEPAAAATVSPGPAAASPEPAPARGSEGAMLAEGFTSLWREDEGDHHLVEVLDDIRKGDVGNPIAYWTKWPPRGGGSPQQVHCRVTHGPNAEIVADYTQDALYHPGDEYLFCALTRFQVELDDLPVGDYHFEIFVDGRSVAENSIRIETRFFTRGTWAVIVIVAGLGLLGFLRRNKVVSYAG